MTNTIGPYLMRFVSRKNVAEMIEVKCLEDERRFLIAINGVSAGEVVFPKYQPFGVVLDGDSFAIWAGPKIFVKSESLTHLIGFEQSDEIQTAYPLEYYWCLVCETSIVLWSPLTGELARYQHNEVIMKNWWLGDQLMVEDFEGEQVLVTISESTLTVERISSAPSS